MHFLSALGRLLTDIDARRERIAQLNAQAVHRLPGVEILAGTQRRDALGPLAEQKVRGAAGDVENKVFLLEQLTFPCGKQGSGDMPLLVGGVYQRDALAQRKGRSGVDTRQKAGHVGALHRAGLGGNAHRADLGQICFGAKFSQQVRQGGGVVEQCVTLAQAQLARLDRQKLFAIANNLSGVCVKHSQRGCIIAGIDAQRQHCGWAASATGCSPRSRATAPNRPLTNW